MKNVEIPFYGNHSKTHCFQAVVKMILKHFFPEQEFTWPQLERMTGKRENKSTWPAEALMNLKSEGLEAVNIDRFDYEVFIRDGKDYLLEFYGKSAGKAIARRSAISQEQDVAREYVNSGIQQQRVPQIEDIKQLLNDGWLVGCFVDAGALYGGDNFSEHIILVYDYDDDGFHVHDPGLPERPGEKIAFTQFLKGWADELHGTQSLLAVRLPTSPSV